MGIWSSLAQALGLAAPDPTLLAAASTSTDLVQLPLRAGDVAQLADLPPEVAAAFGINTDAGPITRKQAMQVPAFARGRNTICTTIASLDLVAWRGRERLPRALLTQPDPATTRQHTLAWTVDDLLCRGVAWWRVLDVDTQGYPAHARWVRGDRVTLQRDGRVFVDGDDVTDEMIRFDGPHEGVLAFGAQVIRGALALEDAVVRYAKSPQPSTLLYDKRPIEGDYVIDPDEGQKALDSWNRGNATTAVRYLNRALGAEPFGWNPSELDLTAARQQAAVQVARLLGMPSREVNAPSETGMTYSTTQADRQNLVDITLAGYLVAIEQRLSMPDVTPRGWSVRFDRDGFTTGTRSDRLTDAALLVSSGLGAVNEARQLYLGLDPIAGGDDLQPATPAPTLQEQP